jgi:hypothetical protein
MGKPEQPWRGKIVICFVKRYPGLWHCVIRRFGKDLGAVDVSKSRGLGKMVAKWDGMTEVKRL